MTDIPEPKVYQHHFEVFVEMSEDRTHLTIELNEEESAQWLEGMTYEVTEGLWYDTPHPDDNDELDQQYEAAERILVKGLKMLNSQAKVALWIVGKTDEG